MAKEKRNEETASTALATVPAGFIEIVDSRRMYKPEECERHPVQGLMLGTQQMNPSKNNASDNNKEWTALVIKLTAPCPAVDSQGNVAVAQAGEEIFMGGYDMNSLYKAANHPLDAYEVYLVPEKVLNLPGGHKMWQYRKAVNPKGVNRKERGLTFFARSIRKADEVATSRAPDAEIPF